MNRIIFSLLVSLILSGSALADTTVPEDATIEALQVVDVSVPELPENLGDPIFEVIKIEPVQPLEAPPLAPYEARLQELQRLRHMSVSEIIFRKLRLQGDIKSGLFKDSAALVVQEQLREVEKILPIVARGLCWTHHERSDIRVNHEVISEALRQRRITNRLPETEGVDWSLEGILEYYASEGRVHVDLYREVVAALGHAGIALEVPAIPGTGWLGTNFMASSAY